MLNARRKCHRFRSSAIRLVCALLFMLFCCCALKTSPLIDSHEPLRTRETLEENKSLPETAPVIERQIREAVRRLSGTPHKMGGIDQTGIDCSGFVKKIYNELFQIQLPRSTELQVRMGTTVDSGQLRIGDLVFFHPPNKIRHVGIYLSNGEFAHVSTAQGVTISSLYSDYWRNAYWTSKRIMPR